MDGWSARTLVMVKRFQPWDPKCQKVEKHKSFVHRYIIEILKQLHGIIKEIALLMRELDVKNM